MVFNKNFKQRGSNGGFTIVELLVVIVVIAILAAITIVSYVGITARAKDSTSSGNAVALQSVLEGINADPATGNTGYPATISAITAGGPSTKLPSGMTVITDNASGTIMTTTTATNGTTVAYSCVSTGCSKGGRIAYFKFSDSTIQYIYVGAAASGNTFVAISA